MHNGRAGPRAWPGRAGPGRSFKARGPNVPKTGRKVFQDDNKLHMKNQNFCKNYPKMYIFLKKIFKKFSVASPPKPAFNLLYAKVSIFICVKHLI